MKHVMFGLGFFYMSGCAHVIAPKACAGALCAQIDQVD